MSKRARITAAILLSTLCYFYFSVSSELYLSSDDVLIAVVTNGLFDSADPFCQYQHPLLCLIIRGLSILFPSADAFTLIKHIFIFGELALVFYLLTTPLEHTGRRWNVEHYLILAVAIMADIYLSMGIKLWQANYTITAGSFAATGIALLLSGKRYSHPKWCVAGTVYVAMAFMLRRECGLLALPFPALHIAMDMLASSDRRMELRALIHAILPTFVVVVLLLGSQALFYSREPYATAQRYNDYRTICVDYPMKGANSENYPVKADYQAATNWYFFDTANMTDDTFKAVAESGSTNRYGLTVHGVTLAIKEMKDIAFHTDVYMMVGVILVMFLMVVNAVAGGWRRKIEAVLAVSGAFIILLYFTIRGRAPLRVWQPVMLATLVVEALVYIDGWRAKTANYLCMLAVAVLLYFSAGQVIAHTSFHAPVTALTARSGADESKYEQTFDGIYIWSSWHGTVIRQFANQNKLPTQRFLEHNIAAGDWTYGQPYYNDYLERIGAANPATALLEGRAYVMSNSDIIENYLQEYYGEDIRLAPTGIVINETEAYRVERGSEP